MSTLHIPTKLILKCCTSSFPEIIGLNTCIKNCYEMFWDLQKFSEKYYLIRSIYKNL